MTIYITRIEPVGEPYREVCQTLEKGSDEIPETELNGEMFCYKRKKNFHEELKKDEKVYDPKRSQGH